LKTSWAAIWMTPSTSMMVRLLRVQPTALTVKAGLDTLDLQCLYNTGYSESVGGVATGVKKWCGPALNG
jgi:hypothetical protein